MFDYYDAAQFEILKSAGLFSPTQGGGDWQVIPAPPARLARVWPAHLISARYWVCSPPAKRRLPPMFQRLQCNRCTPRARCRRPARSGGSRLLPCGTVFASTIFRRDVGPSDRSIAPTDQRGVHRFRTRSVRAIPSRCLAGRRSPCLRERDCSDPRTPSTTSSASLAAAPIHIGATHSSSRPQTAPIRTSMVAPTQHSCPAPRSQHESLRSRWIASRAFEARGTDHYYRLRSVRLLAAQWDLGRPS